MPLYLNGLYLSFPGFRIKYKNLIHHQHNIHTVNSNRFIVFQSCDYDFYFIKEMFWFNMIFSSYEEDSIIFSLPLISVYIYSV